MFSSSAAPAAMLRNILYTIHRAPPGGFRPNGNGVCKKRFVKSLRNLLAGASIWTQMIHGSRCKNSHWVGTPPGEHDVLYIVCFSTWRLEKHKMTTYLLLSDPLGLPGRWEGSFRVLPEVFWAP